MRAWRDRQGQEKVWHTRDAILLCIGHNTGSEKLVRAAARLGSVWHAVYVETPSLHRLPEGRRRAILAALRLAQELGPKPPPSPTRRKRKRSSITPANITSAKSSLAAKASAAGGIAAASPIVWLAMRRTSIWW